MKSVLKLNVDVLSVSSGVDMRQDVPRPAVAIEINYLSRKVSVGMTSDEARLVATMLCESADRAEAVTRSHGRPS
jgi:hypothetical protein